MNLSARIALVGMLAALTACGGRGNGGTGGGSGGNSGTGGGNCAPFCGTAGGNGGNGGNGGGTAGSGTGGGTAGSGGSGGSGFDAGQVGNAKKLGFCSVPVPLRGVVVSAVQSTTLQAGTGNIRQNFWVVDPSNPGNGLFGFKDYTDTIGGTTNTRLNVGDVVNIDAYLVSNFANSGINQGAEAYRYSLQAACASTGPAMQIVVLDAGVVIADLTAASPFGLNPDGGKPKGYSISEQRFIQEIQGGRVHIPGPLTLSNPDPVEMHRWFDTADGTTFGFEVSGTNIPAGLLVRTSNTFGQSPTDGGTPRCDFGQLVRDGGRTVTFPQGIHGVWDTWTQTPCYNGTSNCAFNAKDAGLVPGLLSNYTYAVFPIDCNDLAGAVVMP